MAKPTIAIIGPGRLGVALAQALHAANYRIDEIVFHRFPGHRHEHNSEHNARKLARRLRSRAVEISEAELNAKVVWLCVGDRAIPKVAQSIGGRRSWKEQIVFHSSGALTSKELASLKRAGASVGSVHPLMSFVHGGAEATFEVPFGVEGDAQAVSLAKRIVRDLGGASLRISASNKPLYHAFGAFISPLVIANIALAEKIGVRAGVPKRLVRQAIAPILATTVFNYIRLGAGDSFSGPIVRGDVGTIRKNLDALRRVPEAAAVYRALARSSLRTLPVQNRKALAKLLKE